MTSMLLCLIVALVSSSCHGYAHWRKWDVQHYHTFFPSRALEEERLTIESAMDAVTKLKTGLNESLFKVVDYQKRELQTALRHTAGTHDEDCIRGLSTYMDKAIDNVMSTYEECSEEILPRFSRIQGNLERQWQKYNKTYTTTLSDLQHCIDNYADNQQSQYLINKCLRNRLENYNIKAKSVEKMFNIERSPAMREFKQTAIECIGTAFDSVIAKGFEFLGKMKCCVNSSAAQHWKPVENTLKDQIQAAIQRTMVQTKKYETDIKMLYDELLTVEKFLYSKETPGIFHDVISSLLSNYFKSVNTTGIHNPGDWTCVNNATADLRAITKSGGSKLYNWHETMRENASQQLEDVTNRAEVLNNKIPFIGNVALLKCIAQGYIFAPNTIHHCFNLTYFKFDLLYRENLYAINEGLNTLRNYVNYFQNRLTYPPVTFIVQGLFIEADRVLHELQRCLYKSSATIYSVTTPGVASTATTPVYPMIDTFAPA